jgi:hypothetical protein
LRRIDRTNGAGGLRTTRLRYDVDDEIVYETASSGPVTSIYRFSGWRKALPSGRVIESVLPMVRLDGGAARIAYLEPDGHAMWTRGTGGLTDTREVLGAYGLPLFGYGAATTPWVLDHLHGAEADRDDEVVHFGARHMLLRDGLWMQPEPLLHLGLTNGDLANPLGYGGLYAAGNTNLLHDRGGRFTSVILAIASGGDPAALAEPDTWAAAGAMWVGGMSAWAGGASAAPVIAAVVDDLAAGTLISGVARNAAALTGLARSGVEACSGVDMPGGIVDVPEVPAGTGSKVETAVDMIRQSGAKVSLNPKAPNQEGNVTLDFGDGNRVNLRVETHPLEKGGDPVRHANVEVVETVNGKSKVTENTHIVEEEEEE